MNDKWTNEVSKTISYPFTCTLQPNILSREILVPIFISIETNVEVHVSYIVIRYVPRP